MTDREKKLETIVRETLWMARRYADGRSTYAPKVVNECIHLARELGINMEDAPIESRKFASDGMLGEWDPATRSFRGKKKEGA